MTQVKLPTNPLSKEDVEYGEKTSYLKEILRKKMIHHTIFNNAEGQEKSATKTIVRKDDLKSQEITCDFNGKPMKINRIKVFSKALVTSPKVDLPKGPPSVIRDP